MNLHILSLFVKNYRDTSDPKVREKSASVAGIIGIASNLLLSVLKIVIGAIVGSIAIVADAMNNLADAGSSVITLIGFRLASKPADEKHPYGHERIEYITGLIVSFLITALGILFVKDSIENIIHPTETDYSIASIVILAISILVKLWQSRFYLTVGRHIDSTTLIATSSDSRNDVISTAAVLVGAVISKVFGIHLDGYLGLAVACFILWSGFSLIRETSDPLLGTAPSPEFVKSIGDKLLSYDGILGYHDLAVHSYGHGRCFVTVHAEVPAEEDVLVSHDIIDNIEFDFRRDQGIEMTIHLDPVVTSDEETNEARSLVKTIMEEVSSELGETITMHDFRMVKGATHTNLVFDVVISLASKLTEKAIGMKIHTKLKEKEPTYFAVITFDHSYVSSAEKE